eukprot:765814-Hanusia_phi.AAC.5
MNEDVGWSGLPGGPADAPARGPRPGPLVPVGPGVGVGVPVLRVPVEQCPEGVAGVAPEVGRVWELGQGGLRHGPVLLDAQHDAAPLLGAGRVPGARAERRLVDMHADALLVDQGVEQGGRQGDGGHVLVVGLLLPADLGEEGHDGVAVGPQAHRPDGGEPLGVVAAREDGEEREHAAGRPGPRNARREVVAEVAGQAVDIHVLVGDLGLPRVRPGLDSDPVDGDLGYGDLLPGPVLHVHEGHGHVVAVDGVDEHRAQVGVRGELDVALPLEVGVGEGEGPDQAALVGREGERAGQPGLDEVDDPRLEQAVADGRLPAVRDDRGEAVPAREPEVAHLLVALALRHALARGHVLVVVEGQDHRRAPRLQVPLDAAGELAVDEPVPGVDVRGLHQLDLPVDEGHGGAEGAAPREGLPGGLLPDLDPLGVDRHVFCSCGTGSDPLHRTAADGPAGNFFPPQRHPGGRPYPAALLSCRPPILPPSYPGHFYPRQVGLCVFNTTGRTPGHNAEAPGGRSRGPRPAACPGPGEPAAAVPAGLHQGRQPSGHADHPGRQHKHGSLPQNHAGPAGLGPQRGRRQADRVRLLGHARALRGGDAVLQLALPVLLVRER